MFKIRVYIDPAEYKFCEDDIDKFLIAEQIMGVTFHECELQNCDPGEWDDYEAYNDDSPSFTLDVNKLPRNLSRRYSVLD